MNINVIRNVTTNIVKEPINDLLSLIFLDLIFEPTSAANPSPYPKTNIAISGKTTSLVNHDITTAINNDTG